MGFESKKMSKVAVAALLTVLTSIATMAQAAPLQGGVTLEDTLPEVDPSLQKGRTFDIKVTEDQPTNDWVQLPDWLCGSWEITEETSTYRQNYRTGEESYDHFNFRAKSRFTYGKQKDRQDHCWHYLGVPYTSCTDFANYSEYHQVQLKEAAEVTGNNVIFKTRVTVIRVSKSSRKVTETYQQESLTGYRLVSGNELEMESSTKVFLASGQPATLTKNTAHVTRVAPFVVTDNENGKNLRELFLQYLISHNLTNLLPD